MIYVDTSVLVALHLNEPRSNDVAHWYAKCTEELVSSSWCVTEFASALGIKQRTGQISEIDRCAAWLAFERLCANDLQLLAVAQTTFYRAALLTLDASTRLRAGDALHLAAALEVKAKSMATLDDVLTKNATQQKLQIVAL
jgi:hypothetical protein